MEGRELAETEVRWVHPEMELNDLTECVRAFLDILLLITRFDSFGNPDSWDLTTISNALQWALFIESVLEKVPSSVEGEQTKKALDVALSQLNSHPLFPMGFPPLSFSSLADSRKLLLKTLLQVVNLSDAHLTAALNMISDMDSYCLNCQKTPEVRETSCNCLSEYAIQEISRRFYSRRCIESLKQGIQVLSESIICKEESKIKLCFWEDPSNSVHACKSCCSSTIDHWSLWKDKSLSYLLNPKTASMVSGATLLFSGAKTQWSRALDSLKGSSNEDDSKYLEITEICLLGLSSERWNNAIKRLLETTVQSISVPEMWHKLKIFTSREIKKEPEDAPVTHEKITEIEDYLLQFLSEKISLIWKLPPVLLACSFSASCKLFSKLELSLNIPGLSYFLSIWIRLKEIFQRMNNQKSNFNGILDKECGVYMCSMYKRIVLCCTYNMCCIYSIAKC